MTPVEWLEKDYDEHLALETEKHYGWGEDSTIPEWDFIYATWWANEYEGSSCAGAMISVKDDLYFYKDSHHDSA